MATTMLWKKFDCLADDRFYLDCDDECYYARDWISGGGFGASDDNNLISNFKKDVSKRGTAQWKYKGRAIRQFASELISVLGDDAVITAIPSSKATTDPEYDSRMDEALNEVVRLNPSIRIESPIKRTHTVEKLHHGGERKIKKVLE